MKAKQNPLTTPGTRVRWTKAAKAMLRKRSRQHYEEFKGMTGVVLGHTKGPRGKKWPEVDVLWGTTGLRYSYDPSMLELVPSTVRLVISRAGELRMEIDHQGFRIHIDHDPKEMAPVARARWYRKQLHTALERLLRQGV